MSAYYNEFDAYPAQWLRNLVAAGHIAEGRVDERSIRDVQPEDVGDGQAHFFAGIGAWSLALRLAGVPDTAAVWTGSCPCQPFSSAGKQRGLDDERHLWPEWFRLIRERRPAIVFGEQVASPPGRAWLDAVSADLEGAGYAFGAAVLPAASVGAPHQRHRIFFVAHANDSGLEGFTERHKPATGRVEAPQRGDADGRGGSAWAGAVEVEGADGARRLCPPGAFPLADGIAGNVGRLRAYGNAIVPQVAAAFIQAALDSLP